ncbi:MAG: response regulator [Anaerolineaceae bacterium]
MARILYVDDDPITLDILGRATEVLGHQPILAPSSNQALDTAQKELPDLIMLEMMMPGIDGITLLKMLREKETTAHIPVIVLSAGAALDDEDRVRAAGAQAYLTKPISLVKLAATIDQYSNGAKNKQKS